MATLCLHEQIKAEWVHLHFPLPEYAQNADFVFEILSPPKEFYASEHAVCVLQNSGGALGKITVVFFPDENDVQKPATDTQLMNYLEIAKLWGVDSSMAQLDQIERIDDEYGRTTIDNLLPSTWPSHALGNIIPEYTYLGFLYETVLTYPQNAAEQDVLIASLFIGEYEEGDLARYVDDFEDRGFVQLDEEMYDEQDLAQKQEQEELYILTWPGIKCFLGLVEHGGGTCIYICVRFDGRYDTFFEQG